LGATRNNAGPLRSLSLVTRDICKAGHHARAAHDELVALYPLTTEVQFDEKWSFVTKLQRFTLESLTRRGKRGLARGPG
jgi:hypothetical protein